MALQRESKRRKQAPTAVEQQTEAFPLEKLPDELLEPFCKEFSYDTLRQIIRGNRRIYNVCQPYLARKRATLIECMLENIKDDLPNQYWYDLLDSFTSTAFYFRTRAVVFAIQQHIALLDMLNAEFEGRLVRWWNESSLSNRKNLAIFFPTSWVPRVFHIQWDVEPVEMENSLTRRLLRSVLHHFKGLDSIREKHDFLNASRFRTSDIFSSVSGPTLDLLKNSYLDTLRRVLRTMSISEVNDWLSLLRYVNLEKIQKCDPAAYFSLMKK